MSAHSLRRGERTAPRRSGTTIFLALLVVAGLGVLVLREVMKRLGTTDCRKEVSDIFTIESACQNLEAAHDGCAPRSLTELVGPDSPVREQIGSSLPRDPWGREYRYEPPNAEFDFPRIWTYGRDGLPGGEDDDADLGNWMLR